MADHRFYFWAQRDLAGLRLKSFEPLVLITVIVHRSYNIRFRFVGASIWNICVGNKRREQLVCRWIHIQAFVSLGDDMIYHRFDVVCGLPYG